MLSALLVVRDELDASDIPGFTYNEIGIDPVATSATTPLAIGLRDDVFFLNVDDLSVRAIATVPEPARLGLLLAGLAAAAMARRRFRNQVPPRAPRA